MTESNYLDGTLICMVMTNLAYQIENLKLSSLQLIKNQQKRETIFYVRKERGSEGLAIIHRVDLRWNNFSIPHSLIAN